MPAANTVLLALIANLIRQCLAADKADFKCSYGICEESKGEYCCAEDACCTVKNYGLVIWTIVCLIIILAVAFGIRCWWKRRSTVTLYSMYSPLSTMENG